MTGPFQTLDVWKPLLDRVGELGDPGLAIGRLTLVDDALGGRDVEESTGFVRGGEGGSGIPCGDGGMDLLDRGLQAGANRTVALVRLGVGEDTLLLTLDVCHVRYPSDDRMRCPSQWGCDRNPRIVSQQQRSNQTARIAVL